MKYFKLLMFALSILNFSANAEYNPGLGFPEGDLSSEGSFSSDMVCEVVQRKMIPMGYEQVECYDKFSGEAVWGYYKVARIYDYALSAPMSGYIDGQFVSARNGGITELILTFKNEARNRLSSTSFYTDNIQGKINCVNYFSEYSQYAVDSQPVEIDDYLYINYEILNVRVGGVSRLRKVLTYDHLYGVTYGCWSVGGPGHFGL